MSKMYLEISNDYESVGCLIFDPLVFLKLRGWREQGEYRRIFKALFFVCKIQTNQKDLGACLVFPESLEPAPPGALSQCSAHPQPQARRAERWSHSHCPDHWVMTAQNQWSSQAEPGNQRAIHRDNKIQCHKGCPPDHHFSPILRNTFLTCFIQQHIKTISDSFNCSQSPS